MHLDVGTSSVSGSVHTDGPIKEVPKRMCKDR
jgi:hypothetical protein